LANRWVDALGFEKVGSLESTQKRIDNTVTHRQSRDLLEAATDL
jgi:hypothetical protein